MIEIQSELVDPVLPFKERHAMLSELIPALTELGYKPVLWKKSTRCRLYVNSKKKDLPNTVYLCFIRNELRVKLQIHSFMYSSNRTCSSIYDLSEIINHNAVQELVEFANNYNKEQSK